MQRRNRMKQFVAITAVAVAVAAAVGVYEVTRPTGYPNAPPTTVVGNTSLPPSTGPSQAPTGGAFAYGFDFSNQAPDAPGTDPGANARALKVLSQFRGSIMDLSMYGFGLRDPEPSPGAFNLSGMQRRLSLIQNAGGIPVVTLIAAPAWMRGAATGGTDVFFTPPSPDHYQDYADLCAHVAQTFRQVKYFVVWNEMKKFFSNDAWDYKQYTAMYNTVYTAIKKVRPDAMIGGPYASLSSYITPKNRRVSTISGPNDWGYLDQGMLDTVTYWLKQKAGADFIAVDGATNIAKQDDASITDPLSASMKYAAVDKWIKSQTNLPIWWMESHIQPKTGWTDAQAVAARVATVATMAGSGASVGLQWQPQQEPGWNDQALWTSTLQPEGGQPTALTGVLLKVLPLLKQPLTIVGNEPTGVFVGTTDAGALLVNTLNAPAQATLRGVSVSLGAGDVVLK